MKIILISSDKDTALICMKELTKYGLTPIEIYPGDSEFKLKLNQLREMPHFTFDDNQCSGNIISDAQSEDNFVVNLPPTAIIDYANNYPDVSFMLLYIQNDIEPEENDYAKFKAEIEKNGISNIPENCHMMRSIKNDITSSEFPHEMQIIKNTIAYHENLKTIVRDLIQKNVITHDADDKIKIMSVQSKENEPEEKNVSVDLFVSNLMLPAAAEIFQYIISQYLCNHSLSLLEEYEKNIFHV